MNPWLSLVLGIVVVFLITGATAFFVAQEFAYMAVDRARLAAAAADGRDPAAVRALEITRRTSFMLSGAQLGITVTGLLVGYVAEPLIGVALADLWGGSSVAWAMTAGSGAALVFSTITQMLFGELLPKNYAIARPDGAVRWLSGPTRAYLFVMKPVIWFFDKAAELVLKSLRIEPVHDVEHAASADDLEHVVATSRRGGELDHELSVLLDRILDFPRQDVAHGMMPRVRVDLLRTTSTLRDATIRMRTGSSRYPVLDDSETVVGVVHLIDVLRAGPSEQLVGTIMRPPLVLPEVMRLPDALSRMRYEEENLACVVDEHGSFTGILTLEDLAEEIVGEIADEHDPRDAPNELVPDSGMSVWEVPGNVHLDEVERAMHVKLPPASATTVAGLAISAGRRLPTRGEIIDIDLPASADVLLQDGDTPPSRLRIEILDVARHVPSRVRLTVLHGAEPSATVGICGRPDTGRRPSRSSEAEHAPVEGDMR